MLYHTSRSFSSQYDSYGPCVIYAVRSQNGVLVLQKTNLMTLHSGENRVTLWLVIANCSEINCWSVLTTDSAELWQYWLKTSMWVDLRVIYIIQIKRSHSALRLHTVCHYRSFELFRSFFSNFRYRIICGVYILRISEICQLFDHHGINILQGGWDG